MTSKVDSKRKYKNDKSWFDFWLSDAEIHALVSASFAAFDFKLRNKRQTDALSPTVIDNSSGDCVTEAVTSQQ
jgi:hypothetical protein